MPVPRKATVPAKPSPVQVSVPSGSILSRGVPASSLREVHQKVSIYGPNAIGKTTLACEWPKPLLLISTEPTRTCNVTSVVNVPGVTVLPIRNTQDLYGLHRELRENPVYRTIVFDSTTSLQEILLLEIMGWNPDSIPKFGAIPREIYMQRAEECQKILGPFLDLESHVILISHEKDHTDPEARKKLKGGLGIQSFIAPNMGESVVRWLRTSCGYMMRMYLAEIEEMRPSGATDESGKPVMESVGSGVNTRRLLILPQSQYAAQFRSAESHILPDWVEDTEPKKPGGAKRLYDKIQQLIRGEKL